MLLAFNIIKGPCRKTKEIIKREMELIFQESALDKPKQSQKLMKRKKKKKKRTKIVVSMVPSRKWPRILMTECCQKQLRK